MVVNKRGTWCTVIDAPIAVASCPIKSCTYRNLKSGLCTYRKTSDQDVAALAMATGRPVPDAEQIQELKNDLATGIKSEL